MSAYFEVQQPVCVCVDRSHTIISLLYPLPVPSTRTPCRGRYRALMAAIKMKPLTFPDGCHVEPFLINLLSRSVDDAHGWCHLPRTSTRSDLIRIRGTSKFNGILSAQRMHSTIHSATRFDKGRWLHYCPRVYYIFHRETSC